VPTNDTPPTKPQIGNYIALTIFGLLATIAWLAFITLAWANRGAFHGTDFWLIHTIIIAPALFLTGCAYAIRRDIRKNRPADNDA
jgi:hypothetical protein